MSPLDRLMRRFGYVKKQQGSIVVNITGNDQAMAQFAAISAAAAEMSRRVGRLR